MLKEDWLNLHLISAELLITDASVTSKEERQKCKKKKISDSESGDEIAGLLLNFI